VFQLASRVAGPEESRQPIGHQRGPNRPRKQVRAALQVHWYGNTNTVYAWSMVRSFACRGYGALGETRQAGRPALDSGAVRRTWQAGIADCHNPISQRACQGLKVNTGSFALRRKHRMSHPANPVGFLYATGRRHLVMLVNC